MYGKEKLGYIVVVRIFRKSRGGKRDGRNGSTGKILEVFEDRNGMRGTLLKRFDGPTFKHVSRDFRNGMNIPTYVTFSEKGETRI